MKEKMLKWKKNMVLTPILASVLVIGILGGFLAVSYELHASEQGYLKNYKQVQEERVMLLIKELEGVANSGQGEEGFIAWMEENKVTTSYISQFLYEDGRTLWVRNKRITQEVKDNGLSMVEVLNRASKENKMVIAKIIKINGVSYTYGLIIDYNNILASSGTSRHREYALLIVGSVFFVFLTLCLFLFLQLTRKAQALKAMKEQLNATYFKLEQLGEEAQDRVYIACNLPKEQSYLSVYQDSLLSKLMMKSDQKKIRPIGLIHIKLRLSMRYYTKSELYDIIQLIKQRLSKRDVLLEIAKGEMVILMYFIKEEMLYKQIDAIKEDLTPLLSEKEIEMMIGYRYVKKEQVTLEEIFCGLQEEMKSGELK